MAALRLKTWRLLVSATLMLAAASVNAASIDAEKAAGVMAAYLRHIAALTTWPGATVERGEMSNAAPPIVIGALGADPNGVLAPIRSRIQSTDSLFAQGRPIRVIDLTLADVASTDVTGAGLRRLFEPCELLFLSAGTEDDWEHIRPVVESMPIVTVSEMAGFARRGGMVEYLVDLASGKVRLIVNVRAMRRAGIVLSARLLALESVTVLHDQEDA